MIVKSPLELHTIVVKILVAAGTAPKNASRVADALVASNLCGVDTHGVFHLLSYIEQIKDGLLDAIASPKILKESATTALIDGNWTFGHVVAKDALDVAIHKATENNIAIVGAVRSNHIGRVGEYVELAAEKGMCAIVCASGFAETRPMAVPYGGREKAMHTNPIAIGFPGEDGSSMFLDFATTAMSGSKARLYKMRQHELPIGTAVDEAGYSTTNPFLTDDGGSLLPFGGHKGYGIMAAVEFLGRSLTGSANFREKGKGATPMEEQGVTIIAFRADIHQPLSEFTRYAEATSDKLRSVAPSPGFNEVMIPGDPEKNARLERKANGIPIEDEVWNSVLEAARLAQTEI